MADDNNSKIHFLENKIIKQSSAGKCVLEEHSKPNFSTLREEGNRVMVLPEERLVSVKEHKLIEDEKEIENSNDKENESKLMDYLVPSRTPQCSGKRKPEKMPYVIT